MNKEAIQELMMGVAVVMLGYAAWRHFKPAAAAGAKVASAGAGSMAPWPGFAIGEPAPIYDGSAYTALKDELTGVVYDVGAYQGKNWLAGMEKPLNPYDGFRLDTLW